MSAYILDSRVTLEDDGYHVTCFDGSVGRVMTDDPAGVVLVFEDGWPDRHPDDYYTLIVGGRQRRLFVRDIRAVRIVEAL